MNRSASFLLGALTVGALGIAGPTVYNARESITLHVGDTLAPHYAVLTDTVLGVAPGKIVVKHCGTSRAFLRFWKLRPATHDSVVTNGDSVTVNVTGTTTQPCIAEQPVPAPTDTVFHVFVSTGFETGTIAPFFDPWVGQYPPDYLAVVQDPTNSGHGKVLQLRYTNDPATGWFDNNHGITLNQNDSSTISYGDEVVFTGDLYIAKGPTDSLLLADGLRKLNYWCSDGTNHFCFVLSTQANGKGSTGTSQSLEWNVSLAGGTSLTTIPLQYSYTGMALSENRWHRLTIDMRMNSSPSKQDGVLRIVLDSITAVNRTDMWYVDPSWGTAQTLKAFDWRIGYQVNSSSKIDETRYWDNLVFKIKRKAP